MMVSGNSNNLTDRVSPKKRVTGDMPDTAYSVIYHHFL